MLLIILLIAGVALAANRKQQASATVTTGQMASTETSIIPKYLSGLFGARAIISGPGIGAGLSAVGIGSVSPIVSGPYIQLPPGVTAAPAGGGVAGGGGASGGTTPSGTGGGGGGFSPPSGPRIFNTL